MDVGTLVVPAAPASSGDAEEHPAEGFQIVHDVPEFNPDLLDEIEDWEERAASQVSPHHGKPAVASAF